MAINQTDRPVSVYIYTNKMEELQGRQAGQAAPTGPDSSLLCHRARQATTRHSSFTGQSCRQAGTFRLLRLLTTTYTQPTGLAEKRKDNQKNRGEEGRQIEEKEGRQQIIGQEHHLHLLDYFMCLILIENLSRKVTDIKCPAIKGSGPNFFNTKIYQKSKFFALPAG